MIGLEIKCLDHVSSPVFVSELWIPVTNLHINLSSVKSTPRLLNVTHKMWTCINTGTVLNDNTAYRKALFAYAFE